MTFETIFASLFIKLTLSSTTANSERISFAYTSISTRWQLRQHIAEDENSS